MGAPLIWILSPILIAAGLMIIRKERPQMAGYIQTAFCFLLGLLLVVSRFEDSSPDAWRIFEFEPEFSFLGRSLILEDGDRFLTGLFYALTTLWSLILTVSQVRSKFIPLGLVLMSMLLAAIAVEPFLYAAFILQMGVVISILMAIDVSSGQSKGVLRLLIFFTMGMPFILLAGWYLSGGETGPINELQLAQATLLLGLGFVFWLSVFPFHSWIPLVLEESEIQESLFIIVLVPFAVMIILLKYLNGFVWLREYGLVFQALELFGIIMSAAGSLWAAFQTHLRKLIGYLGMANIGFLLLAIGLGRPQGYLIFAQLAAPRMLSYLLFVTVLLTLEKTKPLKRLEDLLMIGWSHPVASIGLIVAVANLIGMPLTAGFYPTLALLQAVYRESTMLGIILVGGNTMLAFLLFNMFTLIFQRRDDDYDGEYLQKEDNRDRIIIASLVFVVVMAGLIPNTIYPRFEQLLINLEFLVQ